MDLEPHIDAHYKSLYLFAFSLAKNEADAADLTQEAYLQLARHLKKIRDKQKVKSWLYSTLYRHFIDNQRRKKFVSSIPFEIAQTHLMDDSNAQSEKLDGKLILQSLTSLEATLRIPLTLYYLEDYTYKEIAEIIEIPIGTVMSRIYRAKQVLRSRIVAFTPKHKRLKAVKNA